MSKINLQLFFFKIISPINSIKCRQLKPMTYNATVSFDKQTYTDYVDVGECQDILGCISGSKKDSNYLGVKLRVLEEDDSKIFRLVTKFYNGRGRLQYFYETTNSASSYRRKVLKFNREGNSCPVEVPTISRPIDDHFKLAHKLGDVVDRAHKKNSVTQSQRNHMPTSDFSQGRKRMRNFIKLPILYMIWKNLSIYLIYWIL